MFDINTITEEDAIDVLHRFSDRFGWAGTVFTRVDAASAWEDDDDPNVSTVGITDEEWDAVRSQWEWRKGIQDALAEHGWDLVFAAVEAAKTQVRPLATES